MLGTERLTGGLGADIQVGAPHVRGFNPEPTFQTGTASSIVTSDSVSIVLTSLNCARSSNMAYSSLVRVPPPRRTRNTKSIACDKSR
jgi:hypothetical protein